MNLLLDTHIWLWWLVDDPKLVRTHKEAINDPANRVWVSVISVWEVAIKEARGKLQVAEDPVAASRELGLKFLAFNLEHARAVRALSGIHADPFDRALIAQAAIEHATLATADDAIRRYPGLTIL